LKARRAKRIRSLEDRECGGKIQRNLEKTNDIFSIANTSVLLPRTVHLCSLWRMLKDFSGGHICIPRFGVLIESQPGDLFLRDAAAFQQAGEIRKYVEAILSGEARDRSFPMDQIERWTKWALAQADRIDPTSSGRFLKAMQDEDEG
jgi:hypothetical protein